MAELAKLLRSKDPDGFRDWTDDDIEQAMLEKHPTVTRYKELAGEKARIAAQNNLAARAKAPDERVPIAPGFSMAANALGPLASLVGGVAQSIPEFISTQVVQPAANAVRMGQRVVQRGVRDAESLGRMGQMAAATGRPDLAMQAEGSRALTAPRPENVQGSPEWNAQTTQAIAESPGMGSPAMAIGAHALRAPAGTELGLGGSKEANEAFRTAGVLAPIVAGGVVAPVRTALAIAGGHLAGSGAEAVAPSIAEAIGEPQSRVKDVVVPLASVAGMTAGAEAPIPEFLDKSIPQAVRAVNDFRSYVSQLHEANNEMAGIAPEGPKPPAVDVPNKPVGAVGASDPAVAAPVRSAFGEAFGEIGRDLRENRLQYGLEVAGAGLGGAAGATIGSIFGPLGIGALAPMLAWQGRNLGKRVAGKAGRKLKAARDASAAAQTAAELASANKPAGAVGAPDRNQSGVRAPRRAAPGVEVAEVPVKDPTAAPTSATGIPGQATIPTRPQTVEPAAEVPAAPAPTTTGTTPAPLEHMLAPELRAGTSSTLPPQTMSVPAPPAPPVEAGPVQLDLPLEPSQAPLSRFIDQRALGGEPPTPPAGPPPPPVGPVAPTRPPQPPAGPAVPVATPETVAAMDLLDKLEQQTRPTPTEPTAPAPQQPLEPKGIREKGLEDRMAHQKGLSKKAQDKAAKRRDAKLAELEAEGMTKEQAEAAVDARLAADKGSKQQGTAYKSVYDQMKESGYTDKEARAAGYKAQESADAAAKNRAAGEGLEGTLKGQAPETPPPAVPETPPAAPAARMSTAEEIAADRSYALSRMSESGRAEFLQREASKAAKPTKPVEPPKEPSKAPEPPKAAEAPTGLQRQPVKPQTVITKGPYKAGDVLADGRVVTEVDAQGRILMVEKPKPAAPASDIGGQTEGGAPRFAVGDEVWLGSGAKTTILEIRPDGTYKVSPIIPGGKESIQTASNMETRNERFLGKNKADKLRDRGPDIGGQKTEGGPETGKPVRTLKESPGSRPKTHEESRAGLSAIQERSLDRGENLLRTASDAMVRAMKGVAAAGKSMLHFGGSRAPEGFLGYTYHPEGMSGSAQGVWVNDMMRMAEKAKNNKEFADAVVDNMEHEIASHSGGKVHGDTRTGSYKSNGTTVEVPEEAIGSGSAETAAKAQYGEPAEFRTQTQLEAARNNPAIQDIKARLRQALLNTPEIYEGLKNRPPKGRTGKGATEVSDIGGKKQAGMSRVDNFPDVPSWWEHHKNLGFSDLELREALKQAGASDIGGQQAPPSRRDMSEMRRKAASRLTEEQKNAQKTVRWVKPEDAADHLRAEQSSLTGEAVANAQGRKVKSGPPVEPVNKPKVVDGVRYGPVTPDEWVARTEGQIKLGSEEWKNARFWYPTMRQLIKDNFPHLSEQQIGAIAFGVTQKGTSPTGGVLALLRSLDIKAGKAPFKQPGTKVTTKQLADLLSENMDIDVSFGTGQKLSDLLDPLLGNETTRTWTGNKGDFQPAAIDRHALTDVGYISDAVSRRVGGKFKVDVYADTPSPGQYLHSLKFYNDLAKELNARNYDGGGWTASQAQAIGWTAIRKAQGLETENAYTAFEKNTRRLMAEVTGFSSDSPLGKSVFEALEGRDMPAALSEKITQDLGPELIQRAAKLANVHLVEPVRPGVGGYTGGSNANITSRVLGTPEAVVDFMHIVGRSAGQTEVLSLRPNPKGADPGIVFRTGSDISEQVSLAKVWARAVELERASLPKDIFGVPEGDGYMSSAGYTRIANPDGTSSLVVLRGNYIDAKAWPKAKVSISEHLSQALAELDLRREDGRVIADLKAINTVEEGNFDLMSAKNDWSASPKGEVYDQHLGGRGKGLLTKTEALSEWYSNEVLKTIRESQASPLGGQSLASLGPKPLQSPTGRMLREAEGMRHPRQRVRGVLEGMVNLAPRLAPPESGPLAGMIKGKK